MAKAKVGEVIEWTLDDWQAERNGGNPFRAQVAAINNEEKHYCVYASYGQDLIPFEHGKLIKVDVLLENWHAQKHEISRLNKLINHPELENFLEAVKIEAAHQTERWGLENEEKKPPHHYVMVFTKLLGKLSLAIWDRDGDKFKHHLITMAAVSFNTHRQVKVYNTTICNWFKNIIDITTKKHEIRTNTAVPKKGKSNT